MTTSGESWTLIGRFLNGDTKNWMKDSGEWWYNKSVGVGDIANPSVNTDILSPAFWLVIGLEFKIMRSNDPQRTPLLRTTGSCLGGQPFRQKMESYGNFRIGAVWASDDCQGNCNVQYMDASFKQPMDSDKLHFLLFEPADKLVVQVETSCITAMYHFSRLGYISFFLEKKVFDCVGCMEWDNRWVVLAVAFARFSWMQTCL